MKNILLVALLLSVTGCGLFHPVIKDEYRETTRIDTVLVPVIQPEVEATKDVIFKERISIDTLGINVDIQRLPLPSEMDTASDTSTSTTTNSPINYSEFLDLLRIKVTRKADTSNVAVEQKVVTKERIQTKIDYRTPWWNWAVYGLLVAVIGFLVIKMIVVPRFL